MYYHGVCLGQTCVDGHGLDLLIKIKLNKRTNTLIQTNKYTYYTIILINNIAT